MTRFAATLTAESYFGRVLELSECAGILNELGFESVAGRLVLLWHINDEIFMDPSANSDRLRGHTLQTLNFIFDPPRVEQALRETQTDDQFRPLSSQALAATLVLARHCCRRDEQHWIQTETQRLALTHVVLSFQSVLLSRSLRQLMATEQSLEGLGEIGWAEFLRNRMAHNTSRYYRRALGRLYVLCTNPVIAQEVATRTGRPPSAWFLECFDLTADEFLICAFLSAGPALRLKQRAPDAADLFFREETFWNTILHEKRAKVRALLSLASATLGETTPVPELSLDDFLYAATTFHARPVIDLGAASLCVSPHLMMNKFIVGLPYLAQDARERSLGRPLTDSERKASRAPFGALFECYVVWLFQQLLASWTGTEIIPRVYCGPSEQHGECDLVVVRRDTAYVFEVKSTLATLAFRQNGTFLGLDPMLEPGARQAFRAARALRAGIATRATDGSVVEGIRFVVPCVITYDDNPLYPPFSEFYERHLAAKTGLPLFTQSNGIESLQFFDVDFLEAWESKFDLSPNSGAPFAYLLERARQPELRYKGFQEGIAAGKRPEAPTPFDDVIRESKIYIQKTAKSWLQSTAETA